MPSARPAVIPGAIDDRARWMEQRRRELEASATGPRGPNARRGYEQSEADPDMIELRRQQAQFHEGEKEVDRQNRWMLIPALAPAAVAALEAAGLLGTANMAGELRFLRTPLNFAQRQKYLRVGDNWSTRIGRRAHAALRNKVQAKPRWDSELAVEGSSGRVVKPDVSAPPRKPTEPLNRHRMELKPNTPSGRDAAERAVRRYEAETGNKARAIFYDPKDYR